LKINWTLILLKLAYKTLFWKDLSLPRITFKPIFARF
jgi:hypothetical protein